jgi:hypothetical protein
VRPTGLELLRGVRALLATEILPEMTAPHLRAQVMLAVGMLDAAAAELNDAPAAYAEERARIVALAAEALPVVHRLAPGSPLAEELETLAGAAPTPPDRHVAALGEESARLLGVLDRLAAFVDAHATGDGRDLAGLRDRLDAELRAQIARRMAWIGGGPQ